MNVRMLYVWPNLKNLMFHLTELSTEPVQTIISTLNRLYGQPRIMQLANTPDVCVEQLVSLEKAFAEANTDFATTITVYGTSESKNAATLSDFIEYCNRWPALRFWQALRSWSGAAFILKVPVQLGYNSHDHVVIGNYDTFFKEGK